MSEPWIFCLCVAAGLTARLCFLPARAVAKSGGKLAVFLTDFACAFLGGIPFMLVLGRFNYGIAAAYTILGFDAGLLFPSILWLLPARKQNEIGNKTEKSEETAEKRL